MPATECEVGVIGAGAAGLAAVAALQAAGKSVVCLEAADRVGGRILTLRDPFCPVPVELGAEFIHGLPPTTWQWIHSADLTAYEHSREAVHIDRGKLLKQKLVGEIANDVLDRLGKSERQQDESFEDYLRRSRVSPAAKQWARVHVEGFNAARSSEISADALTADSEAAEKIDGDRIFHILNGYDAIPIAILRAQTDRSFLRLQSAVESVTWRRGRVDLTYKSRGQEFHLRCRRLIITVSLGVLQAGVIRFDPPPARILRAAGSLAFGQAFRITFRFREPFWHDDPHLKKVGFFISRDKSFFTWWTTHPVISPLLTGWCAGSASDPLRGMSERQLAAEALASLSRILNRKLPEAEAAYFHNWHKDPLFRGAYSYVPVGASRARAALAHPVEETLFFAGEAADVGGHASTVHGAIESGVRAASLVLGAKPGGKRSPPSSPVSRNAGGRGR